MSSAFGKLIYNFFFGGTFMFLNHYGLSTVNFGSFSNKHSWASSTSIAYTSNASSDLIRIKYEIEPIPSGSFFAFLVAFLVHQNLYITHTP